ncbi:Sulfotransferase [Lysobacter dokdonensis DS-58]|uniref:Sulfotransferase n=1 Tax=Lysobacter dokdonensis DS-58 TaxID=1300345 RepID=A0A0A2WLT6_9GAMM|nr:sulfotransferase [Lysobacter dokdonensis]KGQ19657.1 Sulfotransferase [Lysobacter dokdonensis DS-58]
MTHAQEPTASVEAALAHASKLLASDPAMAGLQAAEVLRVIGDHPVARLLLGASRSACGDAEGAAQILEPLAREQPNAPAVQLELGIALGRSGRGDDAVAALRRAVALKPELPRAWLALGDHLSAVGDRAAAEAAYATHLVHSVRDPRLLRAANALQANRLPEAESLLRDHLRTSPTDAAALRMLAESQARMGRIEEAESLLARCVELVPGFDAARHHYAMVLHRANKPVEALAEVDALLAKDPANAGFRNLRAVVLCRVGDYDAAIPVYDALVREYPHQPRLWLSFGHALKTAGHTARAIAAYREAARIEPRFGDAWWSLANLKTFRFTADDIATIRTQLARADVAPEDRLHLDFALGKALEDAGEYAASFEHYRRGNAQRVAQVPYFAVDNTARVRKAIATYTPDFFAQRAGSGADARDPIFIVGMPRAGSTLVEQILSSHPEVEGTMELPDLLSLTRDLRRRGEASGARHYHDVVPSLDLDELRAIGEDYLERTRIHRKGGAPLFIDKMPNNFQHVGLIHLALPNAKIIDARRHPLACGFSLFKQQFARGQDFSFRLEDIGAYYRDYVALMAHFDAVLPGRVHRVHYETMVEDTEQEVRRLLDYCGLSFDPACLRFFENDRPVRTASSEQVRQPIYREGLDQWRHYAPWLGPLEAALGPVLAAYPSVPPRLLD